MKLEIQRTKFKFSSKKIIFLLLIPVSLSQKHSPFLVCITSLKLSLRSKNFILKAIKVYLFEKNYCIQSNIYRISVNMNFFEIGNWSLRNFSLIQKNNFFAVNTSIIESKTLTFLTMHAFFEITIDI